MGKKILALLLTVCMVFSLGVTAFATSYDDVDGHWAEDAILRWSEFGIVEGSDGSFAPNDSLTRAQIAAIIARLLNLPEAGDAGFADVSGHWGEDFINSCAAAGIMLGDGTNARPDDPVTREETMVLLGRALGIAPVGDEALGNYPDGNKVSDWAKGYVAALTEKGIVNGIDGSLVPAADINRASAVTILHRAIEGYANTPGQTIEATGGIVVVAAPDVTVTGEVESVIISQGAQGGTVTFTDATVGEVIVNAPESNVVLGENSSAEKVELAEEAAGTSLKVEESATAGTVTSSAPESTLDVSGAVENVEVSASATNTNIETGKDASIGSVDNAADGTTVSGEGTVSNVTTSGNNTTVNTSGTKVEAAEGTTGTTAGGEAVEGGSSVTTEPKEEEKPVTPPAPPAHTHSYTYASNEDGKHKKICSCETITEDCTYEGGTCPDCGYVEGAVAKVGTEYYADLQTAIDAGGEVTLLKGIEISAQLNIEANDVILNGNGNTISVVDETVWSTVNGEKYMIQVAGNNVTVKSLTVDGESIAYGGIQFFGVTGGATNNITIQNINGVGLNVATSVVTSTGNIVYGTNGSKNGINVSFNNENQFADATSKLDASAATLTNIAGIFADATDIVNANAQNGTITAVAPAGWLYFETAEGRLWSPEAVFAAQGFEAKIGTNAYPTLQAAINAATPDQTVTLLKNIENLTETIVINKDITLDGNNKTITYVSNEDYLAVDGTNNVILTTGCTINNLTIVGGHRGIRAEKLTSDLILDNVEILNSVRPIHIHDGDDISKLTVTKSKFAGKPSVDEDVASASFTDCEFQVNEGCTEKGNIIDIRTDYTFTECKFAEGFKLDFADLATLGSYATAKLVNCTSGGKTINITFDKDCGLVTFPNVAAAQIGDKYYATLEAAVAAEGGNTIVLLKDVTLTEALLAENEIIDLNGNTLTANVLGTISVNNGIYKTANGYPVLGPEDSDAAYLTTDGVFTVSSNLNSADNTNITVVNGNVVLGQSMCTMPGQILTIEEGASFAIPAGKTLDVYSKIVNNGTFTVYGNMVLYATSEEGPLKTVNKPAYDTGKTANSAIVLDTGCSIVLANVDATLKAPEGLNVVPGLEGYIVVYEDYTYKLIEGITISTAEELMAFAADVNNNGNTYAGKTVKLTADINLANADWEPIGQTGGTQFRGTFDGGNYTISNLNVNSEDETGAHYSSGLFGWLNAAVVKNVKISGATIAGHHNCGVIAGYLESSGCTIENCHVTGATVTCTHANNDACGDKAGVIVGHAGNAGVVVKGCTATNSTVTAGRDAGQIAGAAKEANITGCTAENVTVSATDDCTGANIKNEVIGRIL